MGAMKDLFTSLVENGELSDEELLAMGYDEEDIKELKGEPEE